MNWGGHLPLVAPYAFGLCKRKLCTFIYLHIEQVGEI